MSNHSLTDVPEQNHDAMSGTHWENTTHEPIPGERDATTLTHRQPGAMGGHFNGEDAAAQDVESTMERRTVTEHWLEGGGADGAHRLEKKGTR